MNKPKPLGDAVIENHLTAPYNYIKRKPGKKVRTQLATAFNHWLCIDGNCLTKIMDIVELLHDASLMIDDIEDASELRRGLPVVHKIYGVPRTINTANYIYFVALSKCLELEKFEAVEIFNNQMLELHTGQGKELYWRDTLHCPTQEEYFNMVSQKTGGLFALAVDLMQLFSSQSKKCTSIIRFLALYFQIRDDYLNLCSTQYEKDKGFAEDLTEGKFSLPLILALRGEDGTGEINNDDELLNIIRQKPTSNEVKKYCVQIMRERSSLKKTVELLLFYYNAVLEEIELLCGNETLVGLMKFLHKDVEKAALAECCEEKS